MRNKPTRKADGVKTGEQPAAPVVPQLHVVPPVESLKSQIDRLGYVRAKLAAYAVSIAQLVSEEKVLAAKIAARYESLPAEQIVLEEGDLYTLKVGAKADQQSVITGGLKRVFDWVGVDKF